MLGACRDGSVKAYNATGWIAIKEQREMSDIVRILQDVINGVIGQASDVVAPSIAINDRVTTGQALESREINGVGTTVNLCRRVNDAPGRHDFIGVNDLDHLMRTAGCQGGFQVDRIAHGHRV